jgi:hypothetical protein
MVTGQRVFKNTFGDEVKFTLMWPFKRKKPELQPLRASCSHCRSVNTQVITHHGGGEANYIRTWRGQRYITCRCFDCGNEFYMEEPPQGLTEYFLSDDSLIDDEEALQAAETELKRQADEEGDHRYPQ